MPQYSKPLLLDMGGWIFSLQDVGKAVGIEGKEGEDGKKQKKRGGGEGKGEEEEKGRCRQREKNEREKKFLGLQTRIQMNHFIESSHEAPKYFSLFFPWQGFLFFASTQATTT